MDALRLSERDCSLVRDHVDAIVEREMALPGFVYSRLFEKSPGARALFGKHSHASQRQMLADTILAIVELVDDEGWVSSELEGLGSRHRHAYAVESPMYDAWADSVVEGIAEALGPSFTEEHTLAWRNALELTNAMMRAGAHPHTQPGRFR